MHREAKLIRRQRNFHNFSSAKSVGVLFDATHQNSYLAAKNLIKELRESSIDARGLGFVKNHDAINYFPYHPGIDFFSLKDVNWYLKPTDASVIEFYKTPFDILIDFTSSEFLPLQFIIGTSQAKMRVGMENKSYSSFYDFVFSGINNLTLNELLQNIKYYLKEIKTQYETEDLLY